MLALIGITAFLAVTLLAIAFARGISASRSRMKDRITLLASDGVVPATRTDGRMLRLQNYSSMPFVQRLLQGTASAERIADELDRAAIPLRVGELLSLGLLAAVLAGIAVFALLPSGPWQVVAMIAAMALGFLIPRWIVRRRMVRRRTQFEAQLPDGLDILSRSLRTGNGLLVSIDAIVEQIPGVIGDEFSRMRQEMAAGLSVEDAMRELDRRLESPDLHIVVTAILVQREVGGNLAEILDNVAKTMRERVSLRRELHAITSQERFSTYIVALVPPVILLMLGLINPDIISSMLSQTAGWIVLGAAAGLELCGIIVLRALVGSFEV